MNAVQSTTQTATQATKKTRKRRGGVTYENLLRYIARLEHTDSNGNHTLGNSATEAHLYLKQRAAVQRKPQTALDGAVILVSRQSGLLTPEAWDAMRYMFSIKIAWDCAIDDLFAQLVGRVPDRSSPRTIRQDANELWERVKLPFTEEQLQILDKEHFSLQQRKQFTSAQRQRYFYEPLSFDKTVEPEEEEQAQAPEPRSKKRNDDDEFADWFNEQSIENRRIILDSTKQLCWESGCEVPGLGRNPYPMSWDEAFERHQRRLEACTGALSSVGDTGTHKPATAPIDDVVNLEQVDHDDQDAIDSAFRDLLGDVDINL